MSTLTKRQLLAQRAGLQFGGARDVYESCGYPAQVDIDRLFSEYQRTDLAGRIIDAYPDATWRIDPEALGAEQAVSAWQSVWSRFRLDNALARLDRLMGLGHYGVLLLGLDGGAPMSEPAPGNHKLLYVQPHSERTAKIDKWDDEPASSRFGKPLIYSIQAGTETNKRTIKVHYSRVIHVAERTLEDESIGTPRLERVINRLIDLSKLMGGGAEIYWQNAAMLLAFLADKDVEWAEEDKAAMGEQIEEMMHGLRRDLRLRGVDAKNLAPGMMGDPSALIEQELSFIAGATGIPKRILVGNEAGELASSQDEGNWAGRIEERREQFATPQVLMPLAQKFERLGIIPGGLTGFEWTPEDTIGPTAKADIAQKKAAAIQAYVTNPNAEVVVSVDEFREWIGLEPSMPLLEDDLDEHEPDFPRAVQ